MLTIGSITPVTALLFQDVAAPAAPATARGGGRFFELFLNSFRWEQAGSAFMWLILLVGIIALAIAIERFFYIFVKSNVNADRFMDRIRQLVLSNNLKEAIALSESAKEKALPYVVLRGLRRAESAKDFRDIQNAVDEATLEILPRLQARTNYLAVLANVATLLGLTGTIFGLIIAFDAVSSTSVPAAQRANYLAQGISAAMQTTIMGLFVAVPTLLLYTVIVNRTTQIVDEIDEHTVKLVNLLTGYRPVS